MRLDHIAGPGVNLSGWSIFSVVGSQTFIFPSYSLAAGASVYVHSGPAPPESGGNHLL